MFTNHLMYMRWIGWAWLAEGCTGEKSGWCWEGGNEGLIISVLVISVTRFGGWMHVAIYMRVGLGLCVSVLIFWSWNIIDKEYEYFVQNSFIYYYYVLYNIYLIIFIDRCDVLYSKVINAYCDHVSIDNY